MCESVADGGRRCTDYRKYAGLAAADVAPEHSAAFPDVLWLRDDLVRLWKAARGEDHAALAAAIERLRADRAAEPAITAALREALPDGARLRGLEARMKSPESTAAKVRRKRLRAEPASAVVARFTDTLRYTVCAPEPDDVVPATSALADRLAGQGMEVVEASESYSPGSMYKGVHLLVRTPGDVVFELQVHSEASQSVKDEIHPFYERARDPESSDDEVEAAIAECVRRSGGLVEPAGLNSARAVGGCELLHL